MPDFAPNAFTLFSNLNKSKIEGKENEYWAKSEWPIEQINALHDLRRQLRKDHEYPSKRQFCHPI